ncbi:hypothetical protein E2C01_083309 [Portunus trituberculatus]|uniref:Uncharacterized protein n=1 Tax=Portunus trituberculatus TaxID=210409 RepID=A0A5B7J4A7_PORTR|nr:hypothetical protein [Portunus trituberculatus]
MCPGHITISARYLCLWKQCLGYQRNNDKRIPLGQWGSISPPGEHQTFTCGSFHPQAPCCEATSSTCSTLPLLGVRQLGHGLSRHALLRHEIPVVSALGLDGVGGIPRTSLGVASFSTFTLAPGRGVDVPTSLGMGYPSMGSLVGVGVSASMDVKTLGGGAGMGGGTLPRMGAHNFPPAHYVAHTQAFPLHHFRPMQDFRRQGPVTAITTPTIAATIVTTAAPAVSLPSSETVSEL